MQSPTDHIFGLRIIMKECRRLHLPFHVAFLDISAAFDSVPRMALWEILRVWYRGPEELIKVIPLAIVPTPGCATQEDGLSDPFENTSGARQGCILSPLLFVAYINDVTLLALHRAPGEQV